MIEYLNEDPPNPTGRERKAIPCEIAGRIVHPNHLRRILKKAISQDARTDKLLFAVNESPPLWMAMILGVQHVLVMCGEVALFPGIAGRLGGHSSRPPAG